MYNNPQPTSYKKRYLTGYSNSKLRFGNVGLRFEKNYTVEKLHIVSLKKKFKFFLKKKKDKNITTKAWFFLLENHPIFKKGKNARMGKGKGIYQRISFRVKKNQIFLEFFNINPLFLHKISNFFIKNSFIKNTVVNANKYFLNQNNTNVSFYKLYNRY